MLSERLDVIKGYWIVFLVMLAGYLIHWIPERIKENYRTRFTELPLPIMAFVSVVSIICIYQLMSGEMQPFIYFQF